MTSGDKELHLTEHLAELRQRLIKTLAAATVASALCYGLIEPLFELITQPLLNILPPGQSLIFSSYPEAFFTYLKLAITGGIFLSSPVAIYQVMAFVSPGLYGHEKRLLYPLVFAASFFFISGGVFGYFVVFPAAFKFLASYGGPDIQLMPNVSEYYNLVIKLLLGFGVAFELPVLLTCLGLLGIISSRQLAANRKYALLIIVTAAAIITPTPDVLNQVLMAGPLLLLYELSILLVWMTGLLDRGKRPFSNSSSPGDHSTEKRGISMRRLASLTLFFSGLILTISSLVLFIEPHGRVAFWAQWQLLGLEKAQWDDIHLATGTLFILAALFHLPLNWRPLMRYMAGKGSAGALAASLALCLLVCLGAVFNLPPVRQLLDVGDAIKAHQSKRLGNPPFGHAELVPLEQLCRFTGIPTQEAVKALKAAGVKGASSKASLKGLAASNKTTPQRLYKLILNGVKDNGPRLPETPIPGTGMMTIEEFASTYGMKAGAVVEILAKKGIKAQGSMTLKEVAEGAGTSPSRVYEAIKEGAWGKQTGP